MSDSAIMGNGKDANQPQSLGNLGRQFLEDWERNQPENYFAHDKYFQRTLEYLWGVKHYRQLAANLYRFGGTIARKADPLVKELDQVMNLPRLERFDGIGQRTENITFSPSYHEIGKLLYGSGMLAAYAEPGANVYSLALFYLSSQLGEAGHNCPIACTAGMIKILQEIGNRELQDRYLPKLLESDYEKLFTGAQYLTEVQGGSDVGANDTYATLLDSAGGSWLLNGEKWFCSNATADLVLITARVPGQGEGTPGLGLFLMPRRLPNGRPNHYFIRRLKDKFGTRSLATAEIEFSNALAYQVGETRQGFKNVMSYVINTSRIYNAVGVCGNARRAFVTANTYANHRRAFGRQIIHFPLVQDQLANMRCDQQAILSGTFHLIHLLDEVELGRAGQSAKRFIRVATNLNKYRSAEIANRVIRQAIELVGGNGTIETFSVLPRLLRDNIVYENWEGAPNVLLAQVQRDFRKYHLEEEFFEGIEGLLQEIRDNNLQQQTLEVVAELKDELAHVLAMDELTAGIYFRPLMDRATDLYYASCLGNEGSWEIQEKEDKTKNRMANLFFTRRVLRNEPKNIAYYDDIVSRLCQ